MESGVDDAASGGIIPSEYVTDGGFSPGKTWEHVTFAIEYLYS
jgi:hypothetical protein